MPPRQTRRLYIDESGDHVYPTQDNRGSRFLGLLGVSMRRPEPYRTFCDQLERFKHDTFGPSRTGAPVILHRKCIMHRKGVFGLLRDADRLKRFNEGLLQLVGDTDYTMICVVIDKLSHKTRYVDPEHPYHYCLQAMIERYCFGLNDVHGVGDVVAESRGRREDGTLRDAYRKFHSEGTRFLPVDRIKSTLSSTDLATCQKGENVAGLQLADILAKPILDYCIAEAGIAEAVDDTFGSQIVQASMPHFRTGPSGVIQGYGWKILSA